MRYIAIVYSIQVRAVSRESLVFLWFSSLMREREYLYTQVYYRCTRAREVYGARNTFHCFITLRALRPTGRTTLHSIALFKSVFFFFFIFDYCGGYYTSVLWQFVLIRMSWFYCHYNEVGGDTFVAWGCKLLLFLHSLSILIVNLIDRSVGNFMIYSKQIALEQ